MESDRTTNKMLRNVQKTNRTQWSEEFAILVPDCDVAKLPIAMISLLLSSFHTFAREEKFLKNLKTSSSRPTTARGESRWPTQLYIAHLCRCRLPVAGGVDRVRLEAVRGVSVVIGSRVVNARLRSPGRSFDDIVASSCSSCSTNRCVFNVFTLSLSGRCRTARYQRIGRAKKKKI